MSAAVEAAGLAKRYGEVAAVHDVGFVARPGRITGLLGPNGAGKSTTLRMLLGLTRPDAGTATIAGRAYRELPDPTGTVGAVLDVAGAHPGATARGHLRSQCALGGHPPQRVAAVARLTGIADVLDRRIRGFSTGMRQRLALAAALLGEPRALVLDEPSNGLDPAGAAWLRGHLRAFADAGGTVLVSSHALAEFEQTFDDLVLLDRGRVTWAGAAADFVRPGERLEARFLEHAAGAGPAAGLDGLADATPEVRP